MEIELLTEFTVPAIVAGCLAIGLIIKYSLNTIDNKYIPLIVAVCGLFFNIWFEGDFNYIVCLKGVASGLTSTGAYELVKNLIKLTKKEDFRG